jgi:hypothetical protein
MATNPKQSIAVDAFLFLFLSLFFIAGGLLVAQTTKRAIRNMKLVHSGAKTIGIIIDYKQTTGKNGRIWPVVSFTAAEGSTITFESQYHATYSGYSMGSSVPVIFDKKLPHIAEINESERLWGGMVINNVVGIVFMIFGAVPMVYLLRRYIIKPATRDSQI